MSGIALILAGHGSHISANTAGIVWDCVDRLRGLGVADEITACFWKEAPAFSAALDTVIADDVVVVPLFTARGYFTSQVLPSEMGLSGALTRRGQRRIHLTPSLGEHERLDAIVDRRLQAVIERHALPGAQTAIAVIGHGTRRSRQSQDTARQQADRLRAIGWASEVAAVYLDDDPDIPSIYRSTSAPNILALPWFLADGSHVSLDLPRALGISGQHDVEEAQGRRIYVCAPVGDAASLCQAILDLARDTGLPFAPQARTNDWAGFPMAGASELLAALDTGDELRFGQVMLSNQRVRHCQDRPDSRAYETPAALRKHIREQPFRSLASSGDLPAGWHVELDAPVAAHAALETIYPGLLADWAAWQRGSFTTTSLADLSQRQVGFFRDIHELPTAIIKAAIEKVCGSCIRQPSWWHETIMSDETLPCREACNHWLSAARSLEGTL